MSKWLSMLKLTASLGDWIPVWLNDYEFGQLNGNRTVLPPDMVDAKFIWLTKSFVGWILIWRTDYTSSKLYNMLIWLSRIVLTKSAFGWLSKDLVEQMFIWLTCFCGWIMSVIDYIFGLTHCLSSVLVSLAKSLSGIIPTRLADRTWICCVIRLTRTSLK